MTMNTIPAGELGYPTHEDVAEEVQVVRASFAEIYTPFKLLPCPEDWHTTERYPCPR